MRESSKINAVLNGYFTLVTGFLAIWFLSFMVSSLFGNEPSFHFVGVLIMVATSVMVASFFGRMSNVGVALTIFIVAVALPQLISYLSLRQLGAGPDGVVGEISFLAPWFMYVLPSVVAVITLMVCRHITKRSSTFRACGPPPDA